MRALLLPLIYLSIYLQAEKRLSLVPPPLSQGHPEAPTRIEFWRGGEHGLQCRNPCYGRRR